MTVAASNINVQYNGNGTTGPFSYTWRIRSASEIRVTKLPAEGAEIALTLDADYTVAGIGNSAGGSVTLTASLNDGEKVVISSALPYDQPISLTNQGTFYPEVIEDAFDRLAIQIKQVYELAKASVSAIWLELLPYVLTQITAIFTGNGQVFAKDFGAGAAGILAAITSIGADTCTLVVTPGNWTIDADVVTPSNVTLEVRPGALFVGDGVHTLTINGPLVVSGDRQIFSGALTVTGPADVRASWWGTADYGAGINAANACVPAAGGTVTLPAGTLPLLTAATITKPLRLLGAGINVTMLQKKAACVALTWNNLIANGGELADFSLGSDNVGVLEDGIQVTAGSRLNLHDIKVSDQKGNGISFLGNNNLGRVERVIAVSNGQDGVYVNGGVTHDGNAMSFSNIDARSNGRDGINLDDAIDCYLLGVNTQQNGRYGLRVNSRGNYIVAYSEVNTTKDFHFTAASSGNYLIATNGTPEDLGTANTIIRNVNNALYRYTMENLFVRRMLEFRDQASYVGYFQTAISADRTLTTTFAGSSSGCTKRFTHASYPTGKLTLLADYLASYTGVAPNYSVPGVQILAGTGTPEGAVTAYIGSIYLRSDGGAGTTFYVKQSGANTNTGWVAK